MMTTTPTLPTTPSEEALCRTLMRIEGREAYADRTGDIYDCGFDKKLPAWIAKLWSARQIMAAHPGWFRADSEPVAYLTKHALENWLRGTGPEYHVLLRTPNGLRVPLYTVPPASVDAVAVVQKHL